MPGVPGMRFGCVLERLGRVLEVSWGHLEAFWADHGGVLASLGGLPGVSLKHFWKILCHLEQKMKIAKNLRKPIVVY